MRLVWIVGRWSARELHECEVPARPRWVIQARHPSCGVEGWTVLEDAGFVRQPMAAVFLVSYQPSCDCP
jgi:hypothetical protein